MNRLKNYLYNKSLAKQFLVSAEKASEDPERAIRLLVQALEYQITATNNLASLLFEKRRKR